MVRPPPLHPRPQVDEDERLIRQVAAGDVVAFDTLYQLYAPRLRGYLCAQLGQPALAEEVCQDVLLVVWRKAGQFRQAARLSTWIYGIAWRLARQAQLRALAQAHKGEGLCEDTDMENDPGVEVERRERSRIFAKAYAALPPPLRHVLILRYERDYSYREIATEIGCAEATVQDRLLQAKRRLATLLRHRKQRARSTRIGRL